MQISLRQARRIEREIGAELELAMTGSRAVGNGRLEVSVYENLEQKLDEVQAKTLDGLSRVDKMIGVRFGIRKAIETANEMAGINKLMNAEAALKAKQKFLTSLMVDELTEAQKAVVVARHSALKSQVEAGNAPQSRFGETTDAVTLTEVLAPETMAKLQAAAKEVQRQLLSVVDKLSALNAGTTIELSDEDVKALEAESIVV